MPSLPSNPLSPAQATTSALVEALPYVQRWSGRTVVIKYGGAAMVSPELADAVMQDLVLLRAVGVRVVLVHGGGNAVSDLGRKLGLEPRFIDGLRVTDPETMRVAQLVQVGGISRDIAAAIGRMGGKALGLSGHDGGGWLRATVREHRSQKTGEIADLGRVGDIQHVDTTFLKRLLEAGLIPVIAPVAVDAQFEALNVNADSVANAVAGALRAERLIFLSDIPGVLGPDGQVVAEATAHTLQSWINSGVIHGGMIPKVEACFGALNAGVAGVTISDGRVPHAVLIELLTDAGVGTMVLP
jgi:acetylglutamate kinase